MKQEDVLKVRMRASRMLDAAGIAVTQAEKDSIEVVDFGMNDLDRYGLEIIVYENNDRYCAKELILFPRQICAEHRHPRVSDSNIGKQETFRCRTGEVYLYVEGPPTPKPNAAIPKGDEAYFTVHHEVILWPGDQYTLPPDARHWFQAGDEGAIVSEFSSTSTDENDIFTDPRVRRVPDAK